MDGDPITSKIIEWLPQRTPSDARFTKPPPEPWDQGTPSQRAAGQRLKKVLMGSLAESGVEMTIPGADGTPARMIKQKVVREQFYANAPEEDDEDDGDSKSETARKQFYRARDRAESQGWLACCKIDGVVYLRLSRREPLEDD